MKNYGSVPKKYDDSEAHNRGWQDCPSDHSDTLPPERKKAKPINVLRADRRRKT